jgi:hypothetical protein
MSSWDAKLADRLSRETTTTASDMMLLNSFPKKELPLSFESWLKNPTEDYTLPLRILKEIEHVC